MAKNSGAFDFKIAERIGVLSTYGVRTELQLNRVSWNGRPTKLDLRVWRDGKPYRGITLTAREATVLRDLLSKPGVIRADEETEILAALAEKFGEVEG